MRWEGGPFRNSGPSPPRRDRLGLAVVLAVSLALMLLVNDWLRDHHKYPYLHWWLNLPLYLPWLGAVALAGEVDLGCFPRLRRECFAEPVRDMTVFMALSRLLSVAMAAGVVLGTRRLALALHGDRRAALLAAAIAGGSPTLIFFSHTANLEVPALFWLTASALAGTAVWQRGARRDYGRFGLLAGCAITTKGAILAAYVLPGLALLGVHWARVRQETGASGLALARTALTDPRLLLLVAALVGVYALVQNVVFNFPGFLEHWRSWTEGTPVYQAHRAEAADLSGLPHRTLASLEVLLGAAMLAFCAAGAAYCLAACRRSALLALPLVSYFGLAIVPSFVAPRLVLPLLPILAVWGGVLGARLLRAKGPARAAAGALLGGLLLHEYALALHVDLRMLRDSRYEAEAWIAEHVPSGARFAGLAAPRVLPRIERLGYAVRWYPLDGLREGVLEADGAEWALVGPGAHPHADRAYLAALRAGGRGYEVAFHASDERLFPRWLDSRLSPGVISPRIWVLRKRPPDAPVEDADR